MSSGPSEQLRSGSDMLILTTNVPAPEPQHLKLNFVSARSERSVPAPVWTTCPPQWARTKAPAPPAGAFSLFANPWPMTTLAACLSSVSPLGVSSDERQDPRLSHFSRHYRRWRRLDCGRYDLDDIRALHRCRRDDHCRRVDQLRDRVSQPDALSASPPDRP